MPRKKNDDSLSAASWVKRSRRRQAQDEEHVADNSSRPEYTAKDLAGLRVAHSIDAIDEGSEQVLTLQDQTIDELDNTEESVRLENSLISDRKRAQKNAERRERANPLYGHDTAHAVLDDEEEDREDGFVISEEIKSATEKDGRVVQSAESETPALVSDFVQFKKPRRDKRKARRAQTSTNDFVHVDSDRVNAILSRKTQIDDSSFVDDDDDLQRAIARMRRAQKPKRVETVDVQSEECVDMEVEENAGDSGLLLSGTIEFVQGLRAAVSDAKDDDEEEARIVKRPRKSQPSEIQQSESHRSESKLEPEPEPETVIEQEPSVGMGLAGTLSLLRQRNMLDTMTDEQRQREAQARGRDQWVSSHRRQEHELQKERQRIKQMHKPQPDLPHDSKQRRGKADAMTQRELEELRQRDQDALDRKWAREYEDRMRDYKPDVRLEYVDEAGRQLTTKEAYKQLSHAFHGHYSGKNKVDRVMKKHERERRQNELASTSVTHQHGASMEAARRKLGSAGIVYLTNDKPNNQ
ncbi:hypothetical protein GGH12_003855 [Coemansia sp. RSA 1822]|nr:hypothetical protein LPJ76_003379 [Coemansia sp. RSA 638]KAJ2124670.1 hypothetical protein IW147_001635 [Coemansia sp. RSA 720]KAJ2561602.1 hypothetical protein GGH12_003855 [Coemansia sp. RSA 1822]